MKTGWKSWIVTGAVLLVLSGQVMAQGWSGGPGRGQGMGRRSQGLGPMGRGGVQGSGGAWCPFGMGPGGQGMRGPMGTGPGRQGAWAPGGQGQGLFPGALLRRLNLTQEQTDKVQDILQDAQAKAQEARDAVADAREALEDAVAEGADKEEVREAADKLGDAIADEAVRRAEIMASIKEVLTDEQAEQLEQMKDRIGQFRQGNRRPQAGRPFGGPREQGSQGTRGRGGRMGPGFGQGQQGFGPADPGSRRPQGTWGRGGRMGPGAGQRQQGFGPAGPGGRGRSGQPFGGGPGAGQGRGYQPQW